MNTMNPVAYGLIVAVIGIAVVFVMLTILIAFVWTLGKLIQKLVNRAEAKKAAAAAAAAPAPAPASSAKTALRPTAASTAAISTPDTSEYTALPRTLGRLL